MSHHVEQQKVYQSPIAVSLMSFLIFSFDVHHLQRVPPTATSVMEGNLSQQANGGANKPKSSFGSRQQQFGSTSSRLRPRAGGNATTNRRSAVATRGASSCSSPYSTRASTQATAGQDAPSALGSASTNPSGLTQEHLDREGVIIIDARGNYLRYPYHTRHTPIRIEENGTAEVLGVGVRGSTAASSEADRDECDDDLVVTLQSSPSPSENFPESPGVVNPDLNASSFEETGRSSYPDPTQAVSGKSPYYSAPDQGLTYQEFSPSSTSHDSSTDQTVYISPYSPIEQPLDSGPGNASAVYSTGEQVMEQTHDGPDITNEVCHNGHQEPHLTNAGDQAINVAQPGELVLPDADDANHMGLPSGFKLAPIENHVFGDQNLPSLVNEGNTEWRNLLYSEDLFSGDYGLPDDHGPNMDIDVHFDHFDTS